MEDCETDKVHLLYSISLLELLLFSLYNSLKCNIQQLETHLRNLRPDTQMLLFASVTSWEILGFIIQP